MGMKRWIVAGVLIAGAVAVTVLWSGSDESPSNEVAIVPAGSGVLFRVLNEEDEPVPDAEVGGATTDANGYCRVSAERESAVTISHAEYAPARLTVSDPSIEHMARLGRGRTLKASVVVDETTTPVAGARVELEISGGPLNVLSPRVVTTDAQGIATWENVPSCFVSMKVVPPNYQRRIFKEKRKPPLAVEGGGVHRQAH